jgi:hypothetical protein
MSNGITDWYDDVKKSGAVYNVLNSMLTHQSEALNCVGDDVKAVQFFQKYGGITVPTNQGARVIFFAPGERALQTGASVIIEIPPPALTAAGDKQLSGFILGDYDWWPPRGTVLS